MLNNILDLKGVTQLNKKEKEAIKAGNEMYGPEYYRCLGYCAGSCTATGNCHWMIE